MIEKLYPIKHDGKKYLFDASSTLFYQVSDELFTEVTDIRHGKDAELIGDILDVLAHQSKISKKQRPKSKYKFKRKGILRLEISNKCNNRCLYCHVFNISNEKSLSSFISYQDSKKYIQEYLEITSYYGLVEGYYINFYGGEPLLTWGTIKRLIQEFGNRYEEKEIIWGINTNGRLLNDDMMPFLKSHGVEIHMGCDGPAHINDKVRRSDKNEGTFEGIQRALDLCHKYGVYIQIDSVISSANIDHLRDIVDLAVNNDVKTVYLDLLYKKGKLYRPDKTRAAYSDAVAYGRNKDIAIGGCCTNILKRIREGTEYRSFNKQDFLKSIVVSTDGGIFPSLSRSKPVTYGPLKGYFSEDNDQWQKDYDEIRNYFSKICGDCFLHDYCYFAGIIQYQYHTKLVDGFESSCDYLKSYIISESIKDAQQNEEHKTI